MGYIGRKAREEEWVPDVLPKPLPQPELEVTRQDVVAACGDLGTGAPWCGLFPDVTALDRWTYYPLCAATAAGYERVLLPSVGEDFVDYMARKVAR